MDSVSIMWHPECQGDMMARSFAGVSLSAYRALHVCSSRMIRQAAGVSGKYRNLKTQQHQVTGNAQLVAFHTQ